MQMITVCNELQFVINIIGTILKVKHWVSKKSFKILF